MAQDRNAQHGIVSAGSSKGAFYRSGFLQGRTVSFNEPVQQHLDLATVPVTLLVWAQGNATCRGEAWMHHEIRNQVWQGSEVRGDAIEQRGVAPGIAGRGVLGVEGRLGSCHVMASF
jgi:hypothetical protein